MGTVIRQYGPDERLVSAQSGHASLGTVDGGASGPQIPITKFTNGSDLENQFLIDVGQYGSGNVTAKVRYRMPTATTGDVVWEGQIMAYTPGDGADIASAAFDTANSVTDTVPGTAGAVKEATITISNLDGLAAGDYALLRLRRPSLSDASDTATDVAHLVELQIEFSDT